MKTTVHLWGNSLAIRIPKSFALSIGLGSGKEVDLMLERNSLRIHPAQTTLEQMLARIDEHNVHPETSTGTPLGREVW